MNGAVHTPQSEVSTDIRQADMSKAEECLLKADAGTLVAIFASPPYGDTFSTDAAVRAGGGGGAVFTVRFGNDR